MSVGDLKVDLIDGAVVISTALLLTRVLLVEVIHVVQCCKECKRRVVGRRPE